MHTHRRYFLRLSALSGAALALNACATSVRIGSTPASTPRENLVPSGTTIETVSFKLMPGTNEKNFIAHAHAIHGFLTAQPGFIARRLSKADDGIWMDHIEWASRDDALAAAQKSEEDETLLPFFMAIEPDSIHLSHNQLMISLG
jgi:hypothetical protein